MVVEDFEGESHDDQSQADQEWWPVAVHGVMVAELEVDPDEEAEEEEEETGDFGELAPVEDVAGVVFEDEDVVDPSFCPDLAVQDEDQEEEQREEVAGVHLEEVGGDERLFAGEEELAGTVETCTAETETACKEETVAKCRGCVFASSKF